MTWGLMDIDEGLENLTYSFKIKMHIVVYLIKYLFRFRKIISISISNDMKS